MLGTEFWELMNGHKLDFGTLQKIMESVTDLHGMIINAIKPKDSNDVVIHQTTLFYVPPRRWSDAGVGIDMLRGISSLSAN